MIVTSCTRCSVKAPTHLRAMGWEHYAPLRTLEGEFLLCPKCNRELKEFVFAQRERNRKTLRIKRLFRL